MDHDNPYRAPSVPATGRLPDRGLDKVWRDGNFLVVQQEAQLPPICVKSNKPADREIERRFYWHRPLFYLLLIQPMIYLIVAISLRKRHDLAIPISAETARKRSKTSTIAWIVFGLGLPLMIGAVMVLLDSKQTSPALMYGGASAGVGLLAVIIGSRNGTLASTILSPKKMTNQATWFEGASEEYLEALPMLPELSQIRR